MVTDAPRTYPTELPLVALRDTVVFPLTLQPLAISRPLSVEAVNRALARDRLLFVARQAGENEEPQPDDIKRIGVIVAIRQMAKAGQGIHVIVEGLTRARADVISRGEQTLMATVTPLPEPAEKNIEIDAYVSRIQDLIDKALSATGGGMAQELRTLVTGIDDPLRLTYVLASLLDIKAIEKQHLLENDSLLEKLKAIAAALNREVALQELKGKIETAAQQDMSEAQRQYFLRQQLKAIQNELGEGEKPEAEDLRARVTAAALPDTVSAIAMREIERLERMTPASPEYQMIRTYLDWIFDIPWSTRTDDRLDPLEARKVLDEDHYDLDKIKERIVEHLAVQKLKAARSGVIRGPILCFVGPPGVGKTSLGQSIARAMNRKFVRISLGGVRDEAEIRGHRRTYIGAMPGRIVQALKQAGAINPVFMLDEIDKINTGFQGDPAAALLEVLDPAQNHSFRDHYLEINLDLSSVLFIATSNQLGTIHPALLDRMEIIQLSGYSEEDKLHIAKQYLVPRQLEEHGLTPDQMSFSDEAIRLIVGEYTREAGVRNLERQLGAVARKVAARVATSATPLPAMIVTPDEIDDFLGAPHFHREVSFRVSRPGVATGVAWTEAGGDVLFIEASLLPSGHHNLILTGQLGNVMQESARAAVSHIRASAKTLGVTAEFLDKNDLHVHIPAGAIPKDGPSAGVTMATAIVSALRNQNVREDVAMTGEITLSGLVLPVGGIREKVLAARRHGIKTFVLPALNEADLAELPAEVKADMTFVPARTLEDVLNTALPAPALT
ncbi:MAG: endopeptidase La [Acidobacteriaceae bacterium]|jgi:ATP-dependent Lon protease|nr:endopeptidase La [Acidobacteriaceae bacterium]